MICFAWRGFPQYAARCVGAFVRSVAERVVVVATRPKVPIEGMEDFCGCKLVWVDEDDRRTLEEMFGELPRILIVTGWSVPAFNRYSASARRNNCKVVAAVDNNYIPSFKECIKKMRFRLFFKNRYDGYIVPGESGRRLLEYYGVERAKISKGMYSADPSLFVNGPPLIERKKRIIFVGQFINRKNVKRMIRAFKAANCAFGEEWGLELYGSGPLRICLEEMADEHVRVHNFVQPKELAELYHGARCFCLLSMDEHWGVVVHEAALCGCVLLLSDKVGAADDFVGAANGFMVAPDDISSQIVAFKKIMSMDGERLAIAQEESVRLAGTVGLKTFVEGVKNFL